MSNNIPELLKSGRGDEGELNSLEKTELSINVASTVMSFVSYAMKTAAVHAEHTNRREITPRDVRRAMMIEVFAYFNREDLSEKVAECREMLLHGEMESEEEESEEEESEEEESEEEETNKVAGSCDCPICHHMEIIEDQWVNYVPVDDLGKILKKHIDEIDTK